MKQSVGFVGWRGMVGSVLMQRMQENKDFVHCNPIFYSTSNIGGSAPSWAEGAPALQDAYDIESLKKLPIIVTAQGGDYTSEVYPKLREAGWKGYWIDAASTLRMKDDAVIVLDPVNRSVIEAALASGTKDFIGGNCTVSCALMGLSGLFEHDLVEWMTSMTYQAASGAGAQNMRELLQQFGHIHAGVANLLDDPAAAILEIDKKVLNLQMQAELPHEHFGLALAGNLIPWIDKDLGNGMSREEYKAGAETNKILGRTEQSHKKPIPIDGLCVRIGAMRCHSQAITLKLKKDLPLGEVEDIIRSANEYVQWVPNTREDSIQQLTPVNVTGSLNIPVGRVRKMAMGPEYLSIFTIGDQLLWGAAEPIRRMLLIALKVI